MKGSKYLSANFVFVFPVCIILCVCVCVDITVLQILHNTFMLGPA